MNTCLYYLLFTAFLTHILLTVSYIHFFIFLTMSFRYIYIYIYIFWRSPFNHSLSKRTNFLSRNHATFACRFVHLLSSRSHVLVSWPSSRSWTEFLRFHGFFTMNDSLRTASLRKKRKSRVSNCRHYRVNITKRILTPKTTMPWP